MDTSACERGMEKEFKHDVLIPKTCILSLEIIVVILQVWNILTKTRSQGQSNVIFCFTNLIFKAIFLVFFFDMDSPVGIPSHVPLVQLFYAPGQRDHNNL